GVAPDHRRRRRHHRPRRRPPTDRPAARCRDRRDRARPTPRRQDPDRARGRVPDRGRAGFVPGDQAARRRAVPRTRDRRSTRRHQPGHPRRLRVPEGRAAPVAGRLDRPGSDPARADGAQPPLLATRQSADGARFHPARAPRRQRRNPRRLRFSSPWHRGLRAPGRTADGGDLRRRRPGPQPRRHLSPAPRRRAPPRRPDPRRAGRPPRCPSVPHPARRGRETVPVSDSQRRSRRPGRRPDRAPDDGRGADRDRSRRHVHRTGCERRPPPHLWRWRTPGGRCGDPGDPGPRHGRAPGRLAPGGRGDPACHPPRLDRDHLPRLPRARCAAPARRSRLRHPARREPSGAGLHLDLGQMARPGAGRRRAAARLRRPRRSGGPAVPVRRCPGRTGTNRDPRHARHRRAADPAPRPPLAARDAAVHPRPPGPRGGDRNRAACAPRPRGCRPLLPRRRDPRLHPLRGSRRRGGGADLRARERSGDPPGL
ncbi:MAG: Protoporphyrinogen IX oxidase, aerobic, HemY, partial [uncultured Thermomicrobiales bacterium]